MSEKPDKYISDSADYRHLHDRSRYQALYNEVGTVDANQVIRWRKAVSYTHLTLPTILRV